MIYPLNFEQKIGFDQIRSLIKKKCLCPLGEEKVEGKEALLWDRKGARGKCPFPVLLLGEGGGAFALPDAHMGSRSPSGLLIILLAPMRSEES